MKTKTRCLKLFATVKALLSFALLAAASPDSEITPGPSGRVATVKQVPEIGVTLVKLENNVLLNFKRTDFEKGKVYVNVSFGGGFLSLPPEKPGLNVFAQSAFIVGGLKNLSAADMLQQFKKSGIHGSLGLTLGMNKNQLRAECPSEHLAYFLELLTDYFTAPGFRSEANELARNGAALAPFVCESAPASIMPNNIIGILANDTRISLPSREDVAKRTISEVRQWLAPQLAKSGVEISIVGDLSYDDALAATLKTFGALPTRPEYGVHEIGDSIKFVEKPESTIIKTLDAASKQAAFAYVWPVVDTDAKTAHDAQARFILAMVTKDNIEASLRTQLGATSAVMVWPYSDNTLPNCECLIVSAVVDSEMLDKALVATRQCLEKLAREGVGENDFGRIKDSTIETMRHSSQTNENWATDMLADAQMNPKKLEEKPDLVKDYESITREEVNALAAHVLNFDQAWLFKAVPGK